MTYDNGEGETMPEPRFRFDGRFTTGNVVTIVVIIATAYASFVTLKNDLASTNDKLAAVNAEMTAQKARRDNQVADHEARLRAVEISQASQMSELRAIQQGISRIEASLTKLQEGGR